MKYSIFDKVMITPQFGVALVLIALSRGGRPLYFKFHRFKVF